MARLKEKVPALRWIDFDTGQLETNERPPVAFPCALLTIDVANATDLTPLVQECRGRLKLRIAFDRQMKTDSATPTPELEKALHPYDVVAQVYAALQGYGTEHFDTLSRTRQGKDASRHGVFIYYMEFAVDFDDETAGG